MKRDKIFISYSHKDKAWLDELKICLKPFLREQGLITWDDRAIRTGDLWRAEIDNALKTASVAILLVSPNFLASDFIATVELPVLLEAAESSGLKICWLLISACAVEMTSLPKYQAAHDLTHPLDTLKKAQRNRVLTEIARTIASLYQAAQPVQSGPVTRVHSSSPKTPQSDDLARVDSVIRFISALLEETTLFSAEKILLDKAEFFVGRESEQHSIKKAFESCVEKKRTETVFIKGDFGTGKTSLISKFLIEVENTHLKTPLLAYTQCQKEKEYEGWLPFVTLFKLLIVKTIKNRVMSKKQMAQYLLDFCFAWLKLAEPELGSLFANSNFSQDAIQNQFFKFLRKIGNEQILVIVIDDLPWADKSSLGLLSHLTLETTGSPILILAAFRPEGLELGLNAEELRKTRRKLLVSRNVTEVDLPFGINVADYILKRYHENIFSAELIKKIEHFSDGQALYLDQLFSLLEQKNFIVYEKEDARWILTDSMGAPVVPESIEEVLDGRLKDMKEDYREILKMASVEGEEFTVQIVSNLIKCEEEDLIAQLPKLSAESRFIIEEGPQDIDVLTFDFYKFTHRFFREHIYNRLEGAQRRRYHRDAASYLENLAANKRSMASILAYHYLEAHEYKKSIFYAKLAAEQAHEIGKWLEAIQWSKEILRIIDNNKLQNLQAAVDVLVIWMDSAEYLGKYDGLSSKIEEYIHLAKDQSKSLYARLLKARASFCYFENRPAGAKYARQAILLFHELEDFQSELDTKRILADILVDYENNLEEGIKINRELIDESKQYQDPGRVAFNYSSLAWSLLYMGKFNEALGFAKEAYDLLSEERKDFYTFGFAERVLGKALYKLGQYREAVDHQQQSVEIYRQKGDILEEHWVRFELGASYMEQLKSEEGIFEYNTCLQYAQRVGDSQFEAWVRAELATLKMLNGDYEGAEIELRAAEKLFLEENTQEDRFDYLLRLAQLRILQGNHNDVETFAFIKEAEEIILKYGFEVELVRVNYLYSQVYFKQGEVERAVDYLTQNVDLCKRLNAKVELCDSYEQFGDLYKNGNDYRLSEYNYQLAVIIRKELGHYNKVESIISKLKTLNNVN